MANMLEGGRTPILKPSELAEMGFGAAIGAVANVWDVTPLEVIGSKVIPAVADL